MINICDSECINACDSDHRVVSLPDLESDRESDRESGRESGHES